MADFKLDPCEDAGEMIVAFSSYGDRGRPPVVFEWEGFLSGIRCRKLFLRDTNQLWYQGSIQGFADCPETTARRIKELAEGRRVLAFGSSMGAYGALLFGGLIGADTILAFAPQTSISQQFRGRIADSRWDIEIDRAQQAPGAYLDTRPILDAGQHSDALLIYGTYDVRDVHHADHLRLCPKVRLEPRRTAHAVAYEMLNNGELAPLISGLMMGGVTRA